MVVPQTNGNKELLHESSRVKTIVDQQGLALGKLRRSNCATKDCPTRAPFTDFTQFYPGLILWCDPSSYDAEISTLPPGEEYDRRTPRAPKPCLVVAVDHTQAMLQIARISASTPTDTRKWVRLDSAPSFTWRVPDGWIWVGKPGTTKMTLNDARVMHPHKDPTYSTDPIATANLQSYWTHRQNYLRWRQPQSHQGGGSPSASHPFAGPSSAMPIPPPALPGTPLYTAAPASAGMYGNPYPTQTQAAFDTLSTHPVVVPAGFTERNPNYPGVWRNPTTGWFWSASQGLMPPMPPPP
uniref:Uncharacterized protein n=1 Tax=Mycena chlorophos TaxID=658473 RepID=A0ABQ0M4P5_MYCCL|nr:predicted protein [Mycena chlorophos]